MEKPFFLLNGVVYSIYSIGRVFKLNGKLVIESVNVREMKPFHEKTYVQHHGAVIQDPETISKFLAWLSNYAIAPITIDSLEEQFNSKKSGNNGSAYNKKVESDGNDGVPW